MKLQHKIILLPIIIIICVFMICMISIEYHLKGVLKERFENELRTIASFSLSAIDLVSYDFNVSSLDSSFDLLADRISKASDARISYLTYQGILIGDSALTFPEILTSSPMLDRQEIIDALNTGIGTSTHFSRFNNTETVYFAVYNKKSGFISRVSMPKQSFQSVISNLRLNFIFIILTTVTIILILGFFTIHLRKKTVKIERKQQETRLIAHTKEITFLQTMTTLLNGADKISDSAHILSNIMPKLFPNFSGAISLLNENGIAYELTHWGDEWSQNISIFPDDCRINKPSKGLTTLQLCSRTDNTLCIKLASKNETLGSLHLFDSKNEINENIQQSVLKTAQQISNALANLILKERLRNQATRDPLTNLYNRRFMLESFKQSLNRTERHEGHISVLLIDLDHFKKVNDEYGHDAGDMVLSKVSSLFKENLRLEDIACRYGGEEFCIITPDAGLKEAFALAEKLRDKVKETVFIYNEETLKPITMSIGVSVYPNHGVSTLDLIAEADKALYEAKRFGRNCTMVAQTTNKLTTQSIPK